MDFDKSIENTLSQIQKVMSADCIIGEPIETKNKVIIPISKTALGFGVGVGQKLDQSDKESNELAGAGGGGSIEPIAFVVIYDDIPGPDGIEILPVVGSNPLEDILSGVGKVLQSGILSSKSSSSKTSSNEDAENNSNSSIDNIKTKIKSKKE